jgi:hypothetical protein
LSIDATKLLAAIPASLRDPLVASYQEIASNFAEHRWGPSELDGGKLCECVYWIIDGTLKGAYVAAPSKPNNMRTACYSIESGPASTHPAAQSLRILLPRMLPPLYEIRNNRGVGHVGGDVNPNQMDATVVYVMASFIMAELVRIFHNVTTQEAQEAVDALVERKLPLIWDTGTIKRVLDTDLNNRDQTLALLYQSLGWVNDAELCASVEYSSASMYRKNILSKLHKERLIEFDKKTKRAKISPKGSAYVDEQIIAPRMRA